MTQPFRIRLYQMDAVVGDFDANLQKIARAADQARADGISMLVVPELALTGYPPEDLLLRPALIDKLAAANLMLQEISHDVTLCVGAPSAAPVATSDWALGNNSARPASLLNSLLMYRNGEHVLSYHKQSLPNYQVFDERRYFVAGTQSMVCDLDGLRVGLLVCEDVWVPDIVESTCRLGVDLILVVNASPFAEGKFGERLDHLKHRASVNQVPIAYVNLVGGQDELIFDGGSLVVDRDGEIIAQATFFAEDQLDVVWDGQHLIGDRVENTPSDDALLYQALVTGVRDYFSKTGFRKAVLGPSGGIDSALTLAVAVDALGADNVHAVMMPYLYTADISVTDAKRQAEILGCEFSIVPIEPMVRELMQTLAPFFDGHPVDTTEENLQSRCRGVLLMALSNKTGALVLTTGNKSEMAVGYATLYGDMAGGYAVLKDVYKTLVYRLARWRNRDGEVIPQAVIDKAPSAELRPDQLDTDSLPPYDVLDAVLEEYIERDRTVDEIAALGYNRDLVCRIARMVDRNEYKRRQAPPGVKITRKGFGRDRRLPITNRYLNQ